MRQSHRAIEVDHRSARSRCRLLLSSSIVITGLRWGGSRPTEIGGVIQPCRKASINRASDSSGLRLGPGGPISATTRSRSVTRTVSPPAASRMYSLSLFLNGKLLLKKARPPARSSILRLQCLERSGQARLASNEIDRAAGHKSLKEVEPVAPGPQSEALALPRQSPSPPMRFREASESRPEALGITSKTRRPAHAM